jgi:signal peptidase I
LAKKNLIRQPKGQKMHLIQEFVLSIKWREILKELAMMALLIGALQFLLPRSVVLGSSMEPNLHEGERLAASPLPYIFGEPQRGDIVILYPMEEGGPYLVKRIIGLPNETIHFDEVSQLYVNGVHVDEPYLSVICRSCRNQTWVLGADEYFFLGDNRNVSRDSRSYGAVHSSQIMARVLFRWWPLNDLAIFND